MLTASGDAESTTLPHLLIASGDIQISPQNRHSQNGFLRLRARGHIRLQGQTGNHGWSHRQNHEVGGTFSIFNANKIGMVRGINFADKLPPILGKDKNKKNGTQL